MQGSTALLLLDLQNAFCHPNGSFQKRCGAPLDLHATLAACCQLHAYAQGHGILSIFTAIQFSPDYSDAGLFVHLRFPAMRTTRAFLENSWDAAIADDAPKPRPFDVFLRKNRYDPFLGTPLESLLMQHGISHLVICGLLTNTSVEAAARSAFDRDFQVTLVPEATTTVTAEAKSASLCTLETHYCRVMPPNSPPVQIWNPSVRRT